MSQSRFAMNKVYDTTNLAGQAGPTLNDATASYANQFTIPSSPTNITPRGFGSISRKKYRFAQLNNLITTDTLSPRDEFDLPSTYDVS